MNLTVEQRKKANENIQKIAEWITPLFPQVKDCIRYKFNDSSNCGVSLYDTNFYLYLGESRYIIATTQEKKESDFLINDKYVSDYDILKLLRNWPNIKSYILKELENQQATIDLLNNFEV